MPTSPLRIGVTAAAVADSIRQAAAAARSAGFSGLLLETHSAGSGVTDLSRSGQRELLRVLSGQNQELVGLRVRLGPVGLGRHNDVDRTISVLGGAMESAAALAAPLVCVELGPLPAAAVASPPRKPITPQQAGLIILPTQPVAAQPEPMAPPPPGPEALREMAHCDEALRAIGALADRYSVVVALQSELSSMASLARALAAADCPWFGLDLDPVGVLRDQWSLDEVLSELGPLVRHVRARDALRGSEQRTQAAAIGKGSTDWASLLNALDETGYHGWLTIDSLELPDRRAGAIAGLRHLNNLRGLDSRGPGPR